MRLTRLTLHGFKSFADESELVIEAGVTAVVGPNGCGKSNVSDAVRWVLGEQRARTLRGAKMEEVIFQGSSARRPVNIAEVSLHFDNEDGALATPFREVVITRRLSRSGESEYELNRAPCRLRDIHDLVRGTGLGADAGVVIEARMIDALLSDRPDERRELFEEAAGVAVYRDRRRSAERRLEETTLDLARLDDLITEVHSQVRSLARQRKRAERHAELSGRRFHLELTLASREMEAWHGELARLEHRVATLGAEAPRSAEGMRAAESARDDAHAARAAAEARRNELARLVAAQRDDAARLEAEIAVAEERQRNAAARRYRAEAEREQGEAAGGRLHADRDGAAAERVRLEQELATADAALAARTTAEGEARSAVAAARAAFEQAERDARDLEERAHRLALARDGAEREGGEFAHREASLAAERVQTAAALSDARVRLAEAERGVADACQDADAAVAGLAGARAHAAMLRELDAAARAELLRAEEVHASLQGKVSALEALEHQRVGLAPAAARLLRERDRFGDGAVLGPLSDFLAAGAGEAQTVERYLGATVHAILVRDASVVDAIRSWHRDADPGPLLLLPLDASPADDAPGPLPSMVEVAEPAARWARALLGGGRPLDGGSAFVDGRGAVWLPGSGGGPGPLQRRAELNALGRALDAAEAARATATLESEAARGALEEGERAAHAALERANAAQQCARRAADERDGLETRRRRAERELESVDAQAARLAAQRAELASRLARVEADLEALGAAVTAAGSASSSAREHLAALERRQEEAREERTRWQVEQAQARARLQIATDREDRLTEEISTASARLDALARELSDLAESDRVLAHRMALWHVDLDARHAALRDGEARLAEAEDAVRAVDSTLADAEHALDGARRRASEIAEEFRQAEVRLTELSGRRAAIRSRLEAEWRRPLDEMLATFKLVEVDDDTLRRELAAVRDQLDAIGPVNALAVEEHEEESRRLDFLSTQRADLAAAKHSLQHAIREIDSTARELFLTTFAQVRENFRQVFMTLFGGGECDVRLETPDAPLEGDIEIHASPRGKRTQRIHLLSSGERALVALSLLFGIFLTRPSPFCLLDEVDAPLDDQNVGRFVRMLNEFKGRTQFIVITHNPRTTTEAADAVYGVTMQEPGVSSFVSVRLRRPDVAVGAREGAPRAEAIAAPL